ncbi:hypothetical protein [Pelagibius sp. Alg239-R121]|uniref:hypothetical protein n=1 Tax=Pelagibius sp. Alg239-R121 TaxID=2993448 RepID=UPI0024A777D7|nr:hypothetical protein [Pelagibius sp. Alg239-R121]
MTNFRRLALVISAVLALSGCASGPYDIGEHDAPLSSEQSVEGSSGVVVFSTQTQYQILNNLYIYFIREGAVDGDLSQMIKIYRPGGVSILGTNSTSREYQLLQIPPGKYTLYGHSVGSFGTLVPGAAVYTATAATYAARLYPRGLVNFEVISEKTTYIGDIWLEAPYFEGEQEPDTRDMEDLSVHIAEPRLDEVRAFLQGFPNIKRQLVSKTEHSDSLESNVKCERFEGELVRPWTCPDE